MRSNLSVEEDPETTCGVLSDLAELSNADGCLTGVSIDLAEAECRGNVQAQAYIRQEFQGQETKPAEF